MNKLTHDTTTPVANETTILQNNSALKYLLTYFCISPITHTPIAAANASTRLPPKKIANDVAAMNCPRYTTDFTGFSLVIDKTFSLRRLTGIGSLEQSRHS